MTVHGQTMPPQQYLQQQQFLQQQSQHVRPPTWPGWDGPFPSLHLWPAQDTFVMKMIHLPEGQRVKIGRQTNTKTVPGERNAYFDSKVLSRLHAEIWEQGGKIFIKDVKSSNGTFINNERLSPEGIESDPFELKNEDMVEFGIDIVSEDNRTIVHHKVAAKVYCVFGPDDAAISARELVHYQTQDNRRRPAAPPPNQMVQMGPPVMSAGGKGLSFDHVLHKLQTELAKSKETGTELQTLATAMTDIQDTLGGGLPPSQNGSAAQYIPPQYRDSVQAALAGPHGQQAAAVASLQNQLSETQTTLTSQLDKIRILEDQLKEHEITRGELTQMREQMEESKREMELIMTGTRGRQFARRMDDEDDDDARSVMTLMDDEDAEERVRERRRAERERRVERPSTPEPTHVNGNGDANAELVARIQTLSSEVAEAVAMSRSLQTQHGEAMSAVRLLTERINTLENGISSRIAEEVGKAEQRWETWRVNLEEGWKKERETWEAERERLRGVVRDWEEASRRAHEEEEERELNEGSSEDELVDEEEDDAAEPGVGEWDKDVLTHGPPLSPSRVKPRRRRPSTRTVLAVRALKAVSDDAGASTPKQAVVAGDQAGVRRTAAGRMQRSARGELLRGGSASSFKAEKESSESGKESGDTLRDGDEGKAVRDKHRPVQAQPVTVFTVLVVAAVAGALYYRSKE